MTINEWKNHLREEMNYEASNLEDEFSIVGVFGGVGRD
jgi:hypothetical protein